MAYAQDRANDDNDIDIATIKDNNDHRIKNHQLQLKRLLILGIFRKPLLL